MKIFSSKHNLKNVRAISLNLRVSWTRRSWKTHLSDSWTVSFFSALEPDKIQNLHCRPQNSTAIACSWIPPDSDFDGYSIECRKMDTQEIEFSRKLEKEKSLLNIMMLVPHKRYLVSIKVQSAGVTSEVVEDSTITMIDRKCHCRVSWISCHTG